MGFGIFVLGLIKTFLKLLEIAALFIYKILYAFRLHISALYLLIGIIFMLFKIDFISNPASDWFYVYWAGFLLTLVYAAVAFINQFKPKTKKKAPVYVENTQPNIVYVERQPEPAAIPQPAQPYASYAPASNPVPDERRDIYTVAPQNFDNQVKHQKEFSKLKITPSYYRVNQNPRYIVAEFPDRYELYYEEDNGMKYVRTDYK